MTNYAKLECIKKRGDAKKYPSAFKYACVEKVLEELEKAITKIAKEIGINSWTLWSWYNNGQLAISAEQIPKMLNDEQLFWVRETIGGREKDSLENNMKFIAKLLTENDITSLKILHGDNGSTVIRNTIRRIFKEVWSLENIFSCACKQ